MKPQARAVERRRRTSRWPCAFLSLDRGGKVGHAHVERDEQARDRGPADVSVSGLDLGDVGVIRAGSGCQFLLCDSGLGAQFAQCTAKDAASVGDRVCGLVVHWRGHPKTDLTSEPSYRVVAANIQVGARDGWNHPDAVAPRAVTPGAQAKLPAPCLASFVRELSRGLRSQGGTDNDDHHHPRRSHPRRALGRTDRAGRGGRSDQPSEPRL